MRITEVSVQGGAMDSTTTFAGFGKVSVWNLWNNNTEEFSEVFKTLSKCSSIDEVDEEVLARLEFFVSSLFQRLEKKLL